MFLGLALASIADASAPEGGGGALAETGEALGATVVTGVEAHPEYERYALRLPDGRIAVAEVTRGEGGLCDTRGLTVFPRADLSGIQETTGMAELCERLAARPMTLRARIGPDGGGTAEGAPAGPPEAGHAPPESPPGAEAPGGASWPAWAFPAAVGLGAVGVGLAAWVRRRRR